MPEMTKEERVVCALSLEEPDRVPLYDLVDNKAIIEHYSGQELTLENAKDVIPAALSRVLDTTRVWMPQALGRRTDERGLTYERRDWWNEWQVATPFSDLPGASAFVQAEIERLDAWRPQDQQTHLAELLEWKQRFRGTVIPASTAIEAVCDAYNTVGIDQFVYLDAEDPELVRRWVEALHAQTMRRIGSEAGCHVVSPVAWLFNDLGYKGHLIFSPEYLHEHKVFHHIAEICDLYHSYDLKMIFHSDGYITPVVPDLIATEVDALGPIDTPAGMNLAALKAEFGHQVAFVGGIDFAVLSAGSVDDVRRTTLQALADAGPGGGFILGSSSEELYDALPAENIRAMWETTWDAGRYPVGDHLPKTFMATR